MNDEYVDDSVLVDDDFSVFGDSSGSDSSSPAVEEFWADSSSGTDSAFYSDDDYGISVTSVDTPTYGSLNSTILGYFDRIADGLPNDYIYVAFRDSDSDSYSGIMVYGRNYTYDGSNIVFGEGTTIITGSRELVSQSGYDRTYAYSLTKSFTDSQTVPVSVNGTTLYYSNIDYGYMRLGNGNNLNLNFSPFICIALISAAFTAVLTRLLSRR